MPRVGSASWGMSPLGIKRDQVLVSTDPSVLYPELATTEKLTSLMQWTGNEYIFINRAKGYFIASVDGTSWKKWYSPIGPNMLVAIGAGMVATLPYNTSDPTGYVFEYSTQAWKQFSASTTQAPVGFQYTGSSFRYWGQNASSSSLLVSNAGTLTGWGANQGSTFNTLPLPDRGTGMSSSGTVYVCWGTVIQSPSGAAGGTTIATGSSGNMTPSSFAGGGSCVCDGVAGNGTIYKLSGTWTAQLGPTTVDTMVSGNSLHVAWRSDVASAIIKKSATGATGTWTDSAVTSRTYYSGAYGTSGWLFWTSDGIVSVTL